jgi:hypothetical protein
MHKGFMIAALILCLQGPAVAQGLLDSVFGSGGLGIWNSSGGQAPGIPGQEGTAQPPQGYGQPGTAPPQGYAPPQQSYGSPQGYNPYSQPGVYSDWHTQQPAPIGPEAQQQYPPEQQYPPAQQQQYPPAQQQYPPQQQYAAPQQPVQQQYPPAQQQYTAPQLPPEQPYVAPQQRPARQAQPKRQPARQRRVAPAAPAPAPVVGQVMPTPPGYRPGQYAPAPATMDAESLPAGAVQVTTTTPEGTVVQFYPPAGVAPEQGAPAIQPQRQPRPRPAAARGPRQQPREQVVTSGSDADSPTSIAMPKPVEIPQGHDPRSGWNAGVNRTPRGEQPK